MPECDIGLVGLAVMGENLILNMESRGYTVAVFNRTVEEGLDVTVDDCKRCPELMRDIGNEFTPHAFKTFHGSDVMENNHGAERSSLWSGIQTARTNFKVLGRVTLSGRRLKGYLDLSRNAIV
jgi:hypothetical protein